MGKVNKTDREWQRELSPEEYRITRQKGTEPAFTGQYWNTKQHGTYVCRCCGAELFSSDAKYDSGCVGQNMSQKKSVLFQQLLPVIKQYQQS
ncbi:peptide-methionine (R)-S-oxide reductase, partial [Acinetobacter baumannii]|uniref:peptide-methionine (R)-S-oxide reductase n=1 Tax=Acinetobacter baumannii TaxID=470 RepID=UPI001CB85F04